MRIRAVPSDDRQGGRLTREILDAVAELRNDPGARARQIAADSGANSRT